MNSFNDTDTNEKEKDNNNHEFDYETIGCLIYFLIFLWLILLCYFSLRYVYYNSPTPNNIILYDRLEGKFSNLTIKDDSTHENDLNPNWRFAGRFRYMESKRPCKIVRIDKFFQEAKFINVCIDNDPLGIRDIDIIEKKEVEKEMKRRGLLDNSQNVNTLAF